MSGVLLDNLEVIAEAPDGVRGIREMILHLALRGALAPRDSADGSASILLDRLREGQASQPLKAGRRPVRTKAFSALSELAFPKEWAEVPLGAVVTVQNGFAFDSSAFNESGSGVPLIRIRDISTDRTTVSYTGDYREEFMVHAGDYLIGMDGNFEIHEWRGPVALLNQRVCRLAAFSSHVAPRFVYWVLKVALQEIHDSTSFVTVKHLSSRSVESVRFPLPPLTEQHRIASKVDELMALCDQLEERQRRCSVLRVRANRSMLHHLSEPHDREDFAAQWGRLRESFHLLYDEPDAVVDLRRAVLQLAVRGDLTPGGETRSSPGSVVGNYVVFQNGYAFKSEWFTESGVRLVRNVNVGHGELNWREAVFLAPDRASEFERFSLSSGDIVLSLDRPLISSGLKAARIRAVDMPALLLQRVARAQFVRDVDPDYFYMWLQSPEFTDSIDPGRSNGVPHVSTKQLEQLPFSPPSLDEQRHIVAKVSELMVLCDDLEVSLKESRQHAARLVVSVMNCLRAA